MSQAPIDPFALTKLSMSQGEIQHRRTMENLDRNFAERQFAYKQQMNDRDRNDRLYMSFQGKMNADFTKRFSESMGEMTFGAMMADVRAQRAANTPPLFVFDHTDVIPNPQGNQILAGAGPGAGNTPPGTIPQPTTDRVAPDPKTDEDGEPVAKSVTPDKPEPGQATAAPTGTPQQQNVQRVRQGGGQRGGGRVAGPNMLGMRSTLNAVHVDPVTGQMFGNIRGHMIPLDEQAWDMMQTWQRNQITSYQAETRRMDARTYRGAVSAQDELLNKLTENSNHGTFMAITEAFPDMPDWITGDLERAKNKLSRSEYNHHAGEIVTAHRSGDPAALDSAGFSLTEALYKKDMSKIDDELIDVRRELKVYKQRYEDSGKSDISRNKSILTDIERLQQKERELERRRHAQLPPSSSREIFSLPRSRPSKPTTPVESYTEDAFDSFATSMNLTGVGLNDLLYQEFSQKSSNVADQLIDTIKHSLDQAKFDHSNISDASWLEMIGRWIGADRNGDINITSERPGNQGRELLPRPPSTEQSPSPRSSAPAHLPTLVAQYRETLQGNPESKETWNAFVIERGYGHLIKE